MGAEDGNQVKERNLRRRSLMRTAKLVEGEAMEVVQCGALASTRRTLPYERRHPRVAKKLGEHAAGRVLDAREVGNWIGEEELWRRRAHSLLASIVGDPKSHAGEEAIG